MSFAQWQPDYAAHGLATFPVQDKRPAVRNYLRIGLPASCELARKFPNASALGFALGNRSKITVLDVDSKDERILADAMARHGQPPVVVRSGSGHFQAWYRYNGERRHIRPIRGLPVDVLGAGFVVAPPSRGIKAPYQIVEGSLDDLGRLPVLQNFAPEGDEVVAAIPVGQRNSALFRHCMRHARSCDDFEALQDVAATFAAQCEQDPDAVLTPEEIARVARSAWNYTQCGQNWVGAEHIDFDHATFPPSTLSSDPPLYVLLCWLRDHDGAGRLLMVADALANVLGWSNHLLREARRRAIEGGWLILVEPRTRTRAARYAWGPSATCHNLCNPKVIRDGELRKEGGSVYRHLRNPEVIHAAVMEAMQ